MNQVTHPVIPLSDWSSAIAAEAPPPRAAAPPPPPRWRRARGGGRHPAQAVRAAPWPWLRGGRCQRLGSVCARRWHLGGLDLEPGMGKGKLLSSGPRCRCHGWAPQAHGWHLAGGRRTDVRRSSRSEVRTHLLLFSFSSQQTKAPFRSLPNSKFLHSLSITSILGHMHGAVNVCKKNN
jgi:hypothetical protein